MTAITADDIMITRDLMSRQLVICVDLPNGDRVQDDLHLRAVTDLVPDILARTGQDITDLLAAEIADCSYPLPEDVLDWADQQRRIVAVDVEGFGYRVTYNDGRFYKTPYWSRDFIPFFAPEPMQAAE